MTVATGTALVTGITGQDGGYLAERLLAEGWSVHGMVRPGDRDVAELTARCPGVVLHEGDLRDDDSLARVVRAVSPSEVYHLGGISSVAYSWQHPVLTADVVALGTARLLQQVLREQDRSGHEVRTVLASSAEIWGEPARSPQDESTPVRPTSPYGAAKAHAHALAAVYRSLGLPAASLVLYNHESARRPPTFVTRKITQGVARIARGEQDELVLGNLDARRDWGWAPDYVDAMVRAARHDAADDYVIGTGEAHTVREFVAAAFARAGVTGWEARVKVDPSLVRPADGAVQVADARRARSVLGWRPTVAFAELVGRMVDVDLTA